MNWTAVAIAAAPGVAIFLCTLAFIAVRRRMERREWAKREQCIREKGYDPKTGKRCPSDAEFKRTLDEFDRALADMKADIARRRAAREQVTQ